MVSRRRVLEGVTVAGVTVAGGAALWMEQGGGAATATNDGTHCHTGVISRPDSDAFTFILIISVDGGDVRATIDVATPRNVGEIVVSTDDEVKRTKQQVESPRQNIVFPPGDETEFELSLRGRDGQTLDSGRFYVRCGDEQRSKGRSGE